VGRFAEAAELAREVRTCAAEMEDEMGVLRGIWLQGRIAAGLGQAEEARSLLGQARQAFAARKMDYDMALALLEEAALILDESRTAGPARERIVAKFLERTWVRSSPFNRLAVERLV
jgi:hypothetical protein